MRVVHIVQRLAPGGLEVMALDLMRATPDVSDALIISLEGDAGQLVDEWARLEAVKHRIIGLDKPAGVSASLIFRLRAALKLWRADIVHTHHIGPLLYGGIAARLCGAAHVHTEHDVWHLQSAKARWLEAGLLKLCRPSHVAITDDMAGALSATFGRDVHVIENGVDTTKFVLPATMREAGNVKIVGAAGRLELVKGMDLLINGFASFAQGKAYELRIAGDGAQRPALQSQIDMLMAKGSLAADQVRLVGRVDDMPAFLQSLDYFVQPSRAEGLPLAPLEAMACGVPVLVTPTASANTLRQAGVKVCADISAGALAEGLDDLTGAAISNADIRAAAEKKFSLDVMASRYASLYKKCTEGKR